MRDVKTDRGLWRGVLSIVLVGTAVGLLYNFVGLQSTPSWGLSWISVDRMEQLAGMPTVTAPTTAPAPASISDDPLAIPANPAAAGGLPEIPAVGRPVQIELAAFKMYFDAGAAVIADAREPGEFADSHIPGAINLPYDQVASDPARLEALVADGRPVITYCGGGTCEVSMSLADELFYAGHRRVAVYVGGFPEWIAAGYPTASGPGGSE